MVTGLTGSTVAKALALASSMAPANIQELFFKRLYINYSDNVKPANVKFDRRDNGWTLKVNYEVRRQLIGNLDVVGKFDSSQDLTRSGAQ